jgi:hypothetical protein
MLEFLSTYIIKPIMSKQFSYTYGSEIDQYISNKNPTTTSEVEYWEREFARKQLKQGWLA